MSEESLYSFSLTSLISRHLTRSLMVLPCRKTVKKTMASAADTNSSRYHTSWKQLALIHLTKSTSFRTLTVERVAKYLYSKMAKKLGKFSNKKQEKIPLAREIIQKARKYHWQRKITKYRKNTNDKEKLTKKGKHIIARKN